jgi:hypothetical protein
MLEQTIAAFDPALSAALAAGLAFLTASVWLAGRAQARFAREPARIRR